MSALIVETGRRGPDGFQQLAAHDDRIALKTIRCPQDAGINPLLATNRKQRAAFLKVIGHNPLILSAQALAADDHFVARF
jgi:hypothetical protein